MDDLIAFMSARYDEAQARAEAAAATEDGAVWVTSNAEDSDKRIIRTPAPDWRWIGEHYTETAEHITDTDPAHRLADIKLKRAILAGHAPAEGLLGRPVCRVCWTVHTDGGPLDGDLYPCATARHLGTEFSDHAGYKPEWRPQHG